MSSFFDKPFDATKVEPQGAYKPIPAGDYLVMIKGAAEEPTKNRNGKMLHLALKVLNEGPAKGREVHWRINLENSNPQAVEIGHRQLSAVCRAVGIVTPKRAGDFVNKTMTVKVAVVPRSDDPKELSNEVKGVVLQEPAKGGSADAPTAGGAAAEKPPWAQ